MKGYLEQLGYHESLILRDIPCDTMTPETETLEDMRAAYLQMVEQNKKLQEEVDELQRNRELALKVVDTMIQETEGK